MTTNKNMPQSERYAKFMGSWMSGSIMGYFIGIIIGKVIVLIVLYKIFIANGFWRELLNILLK